MAYKNIKGFLNEIEEYDKFRAVFRLIYMYGAYSDKDIVESKKLSISSRSLADYIRRIDNYVNSGNIAPFGSHNLDGRKTDKKSRCFYTDVYKYSDNYLLNTFNQHSITQSDLIFYLYFLILFSSYEYNLDDEAYNYLSSQRKDCLLDFFPLCCNSFTFDELFAGMEELYENNSSIINSLSNRLQPSATTDFPLTIDVCKAKLNELCDLGIVEKISDFEYRITNYPFPYEEYSNSNHYPNLLALRELCDFFKNVYWISVPGKNIVDKLDSALMSEEYIPSELNYSSSEYFSPSILYRDVNYQNILDNDIIWNIVNAIDQKRILTYHYQVYDYSSERVYNTIPLKIIVDKQYGRQYLWGRSVKPPGSFAKGDYTYHRLDRISDIQFKETISEEDERFLCTDNSNENHTDILVHLKTASQPELNELIATLNTYDINGEIVHLSDNSLTVDYHIRETSSEELIPWLNSLNCSFKIDATANPTFTSKYDDYIKEWLNLYESV